MFISIDKWRLWILIISMENFQHPVSLISQGWMSKLVFNISFPVC